MSLAEEELIIKRQIYDFMLYLIVPGIVLLALLTAVGFEK
jgi:hypothetical protein